MRLFIGIPLSAEASGELLQISRRLRSQDDRLRWPGPESWHITLQFLGNASQEQYACMVARLIGLRCPPISISLESFGFFERAGIFYVGVQATKPLLALQQAISAATAPCGFLAENRPYHPHITIARSKGKRGMDALNRLRTRLPRAPRLTSFLAQHFLLYESFTDPSGSRYEVRERFVLNNIDVDGP